MVAFADDPGQRPHRQLRLLLFFAIKQMGAEEDASQFYGKMADHQVLDIVREERAVVLSAISPLPICRARPSTRPATRASPKPGDPAAREPGAQFVGSLGGLPLTPNIDALSKEGWAFEQLYATGTRSVRGIEAVLTGFTPTLAQAVVKLGKSQTNFFTIADLLKAARL